MLKTKITCIVGDLTKQPECDAIVNSANPSMRAGSGVCGAIHRAAGRGLEKFGMPLGPLSLGQAVITSGFNLPNKHVIHLSAPRYHLDPDPPRNLALAINNALKLAEDNGIKRIAFPAVATGIYGYPMNEAIEIFVNTVAQFRESKVLEEIRFVFFSKDDAFFMQKCLMTNQELIDYTNPPLPLCKAFLEGDEEGMVQLLELLLSCHRLVCGMDDDIHDWDQCDFSWTIEQWYVKGTLTEALRNVASNWTDAKKVAEQWFKDFPHTCGDQEWWHDRRDELEDPTAISYFRTILLDRVKEDLT